MVDLSAGPALQKGWQAASGVCNLLSGLGRRKKLGNVLYE